MKKSLFLFLGIIIAAGNSSAKIVQDSLYEIPKTKIAPIIDGKQDAVWKTLDWNMQRTYSVGDPPTPTDSGASLSGMSKAMWDENNLYILFYTIDDVLVDIPANPAWNQDGIEIFIDGDNSKILDGVAPDPGGGLAPGDFLINVPHLFKGAEDINRGNIIGIGALDTTGMIFRIRDVEDNEGFPGWMLEIKIPLENLGIDGFAATNQLIGWELQQDECDDALAGRKGMSKWWHYSNNSWTNASIWGTAILSDRLIDSVLEIKKVPSGVTITVDGELDPVYKMGNPVTTNIFRVGDPPGADAVNTDPLFGGFVTVYPLWDENNYYVFFDVVDAMITNIPANPNWNQDAVEFFIDADNSKTPDGISPDPGGGLAPGDFQLTIAHMYLGAEAANIGNIGLPVGAQANASFKIVDKADGNGYFVELKMRLDDLGIDPTIGTTIGFEFQMDNSNDASVGRQGMEKWFHPSNNSWTDASLWGTAVLGTLTGTPSGGSVFSTNQSKVSFRYVKVNTASHVKNYVLFGSNLSPENGDIAITAPPNFEISLSSFSGFGSMLNVPFTGGSFSTAIFVRFKPTAEIIYQGRITNSINGEDSVFVDVSGYSHLGPRLLSIIDVPNDQGGKVTVAWEPSAVDTFANPDLVYSIWRSAPQGMMKSLAGNQMIISSLYNPGIDVDLVPWECIANQPALQFETYSYNTATRNDSMALVDGKQYFKIAVQTADSNILYVSNIDSGYSVDNLPPAKPQNFKLRVKPKTVTLLWDQNYEKDLQGYAIYRCLNSYTPPSKIEPYAFTTDVNYIDSNAVGGIHTYYYICAQDIHGNKSEPSSSIDFIPTGINDETNGIPKEFVLQQNYPNPFNPSTTIRYGIPTHSNVKIQIYNVLGQVLADLVDGEKEAGWHYVDWNPSVSSGIYFYRIEAISISDPSQRFVQLKKLLFIK